MKTRIYDNCGANRAEMNFIRQIEKTKLMKLLERERTLASLLADHHSTLILRNSRRPIAPVEEIISQIYAHPEIREIENRIHNILDAYREFKHLAERIGDRIRSHVRDKLRMVSDAVTDPF